MNIPSLPPSGSSRPEQAESKQHSLASYILLHLAWVTLIVAGVALISLTYTHTVDSKHEEVAELGERLEGYVFLLSALQRNVKYTDLEQTAEALANDKNIESIRALSSGGAVLIEVENKSEDTELHKLETFPVHLNPGQNPEKVIGYLEFKTVTSSPTIIIPPIHILVPAILVCIIFAFLAKRMLDKTIVRPIKLIHRNIEVSDLHRWSGSSQNLPREISELNRALYVYMTAVEEKTHELDHQNQLLQDQMKINRQAQRELFELQKRESLAHFSSGISHDFNNILMTILGSLEIMQIMSEDEELLNYLENCIDTVTYASGLTSKLLSISRDSEFSPARVSLTGVLNQQSKWVGRILPDNIQINWQVPDTDMTVFLDESMLISALLNLIVNARDAMPGGGEIRISVSKLEIQDNVRSLKAPLLQSGLYFMVEVADTGTGIEPSLQKKIFEPFYTSKEEGAGTGLGLAMVKSFVDQSGGALTVDSAVGKGTAFQLYFPHHPEREEDPGDSTNGWIDPQTLSDIRLLAVEDNPSARAILEAILEQAEISVKAVSTADEAQNVLAEEPGGYDVLITDANLRGKLQGLDLIDSQNRSSYKLGVILMSGNVIEAARFRDSDKNDFEFLQKPFTRKELFNAIATSLDKRDNPSKKEKKDQSL